MDRRKTPRRAAIYARVSTASQDVENQLRVLRDLAERAGWEIVHEYCDTASGASAYRPGLVGLLADAARRKFDVVMVWDISRLGRSLRDLLNTFEALRKVQVDLMIHQQGVDTGTPIGEAMMQMSGIFAQFERSMVVERTKAGMERARARGARIGRPPAGEGVVAAIRSLRQKGVGMDRIARKLKCGKSLSMRVCQQFDREQKAMEERELQSFAASISDQTQI